MKYIKKYENFDFSQTLPVAAENDLTNFYSCDECNAIWRVYNSPIETKCKFCRSTDIEELSKEEWLELSKERLEFDDFSDLEKDINDKDSVKINLNNPTKYD